MSEQPEQTEATSETPAAEDPLHLPDDHPLVKTLAEQKKAIKELKARAARLDELEESQKSEAEKASERLSKAEQRATEAEARALRREVALEFRLPKERADLLDGITDETAMRNIAAALAEKASDAIKNGNHVPREGANPPPAENEELTAVRGIFGRT